MRARPPTSLGGLAVTGVDDLSQGYAGLPPTTGLRFTLTHDARVIVRPSGTEPKIKCYLEVVIPVEADVDAARINAAGRLMRSVRTCRSPQVCDRTDSRDIHRHQRSRVAAITKLT
ncbi:MAG: hypothetical protein R2709_13450 [Marmoricola sp.]